MKIKNLIDGLSHESYINKILTQMDDIEYRRVMSSEDLIPVECIRRASYFRANSFSNPNQPIIDKFDYDPKFYLYSVYWREKICASIRIHILNKENKKSNSINYFPNVIGPLLEQGKTFMDPTRFVVDPELDHIAFGLPIITLRLGFLAAKHFDCDFCLSMIRPRHSAFYRKIFRSTQITPAVNFQAFNDPYALHSSPKSMEETICNRYPIFLSLEKERKMLFDKPKPGYPANLSVKPTARIAIQIQNQRHVGNMAS